MSTSLLYYGFGICGYQYVKTTYEAGRVTFTLLQERGNLRCAACGSRHVVRWGFQPRSFRSLPIGCRPVQIELPVARVSVSWGPWPLWSDRAFSGKRLAQGALIPSATCPFFAR
jgi:hypothetical protein